MTWHVAVSEIDHHAPLPPPQLARDDARAHTFARLGDRAIWQADDDRRAMLRPLTRASTSTSSPSPRSPSDCWCSRWVCGYPVDSGASSRAGIHGGPSCAPLSGRTRRDPRSPKPKVALSSRSACTHLEDGARYARMTAGRPTHSSRPWRDHGWTALSAPGRRSRRGAVHLRETKPEWGSSQRRGPEEAKAASIDTTSCARPGCLLRPSELCRHIAEWAVREARDDVLEAVL
jgi:hypothetical protein